MDRNLAADIENLLKTEKYIGLIDNLVEKGKDVFIIDFQDLSEESREGISIDYAGVLKSRGRGFESVHEWITQKIKVEARNRGTSIDSNIMLFFTNIENKKSMRELTSTDINTLMVIEGIITSVTAPKSIISTAAYHCPKCGETLLISQDSSELQKPQKCPSCQARRGFILKETECSWDDYQELYLQENPEEVKTGVIPRMMKATAMGRHLMDMCRPGDIVNIVCTMIPRPTKRTGTRIFEWWLEINNIKVLNEDIFSINLTEDERTEIEYWSSHPKIRDIIVNSISPSIYGNWAEKWGITVSLFGGVDIKKLDIQHRGTINVVLVGDPSTGKSQMLIAAANVAPKAIYTTGLGSSGVGLTAAAIKDDVGWRLVAGPVVLADMGNCCIDEIEKMKDEDRAMIHSSMSIQSVRIDKADIHASLNARTAIIAAANPKGGRYDPYLTLADNISLPSTILSRFDLIFIMRDIPEEEKDKRLMKHILKGYKRNENEGLPVMDRGLLKKYILYAKTIDPKLSDEAINVIVDFYTKMRGTLNPEQQSPIAIGARQGEGLRRIAEASARMALKDVADKEDAELAVELMRKVLERAGLDPDTGKIDVGIIETGKSQSKEGKKNMILGILRRDRDPVHIDDLIEEVSDFMDEGEVRRLLRGMDSITFNPHGDYYNAMNAL